MVIACLSFIKPLSPIVVYFTLSPVKDLTIVTYQLIRLVTSILEYQLINMLSIPKYMLDKSFLEQLYLKG
ncbi:hypothetical protein GCM10008924_08400 [Gracilibacillus halotolerans]